MLLCKLSINTFHLTRGPFILEVLVSFTAFQFPPGREPSVLHVPRGICKRLKFPPTVLNTFSEGCDYRSLLALSPQAAAVCSWELWTTNHLLEYWKVACINFPFQTLSVVAGRGGVNHCPLFCFRWLESLASHLVQAGHSSSQRSLGKALQYPGIWTILNRLGATYGAKWLDYKKTNHICCLIFLSIWDQAFCSIRSILHATKLLCLSLCLVPRGIVYILMFAGI